MRLPVFLGIFAFASLGPAQAPPLAIKNDNSPLRAGCSESTEQVATLRKDTPVKIRYALAGSGRPCYAVVAEVDGHSMQGYVWAEALAGIEEFERARRSSSVAASESLPLIDRGRVQAVREWANENSKAGKLDYALAAQLNLAADALQNGRPAEADRILAKVAAPRGHREVALLRGQALLQLNQPDRALDVLETALRENQRDAQLLALAGKAAYNADHGRRALAYWKDAQELHADPALEQVYRKLEKETAADKSSEKSYGMRFLLRYDTAVASPEIAGSMVAVLEEEFARISTELGCPAEERIITIVQSRESYRAFSPAEWTGGHYDGKIHIPIAPGKSVDPSTRRVFAHEIVHACLANIGPWPAWLHEGLAQKVSGDRLQPPQREVLKVLARAGQLPKLEDLGNGWARLNITQASVAYSLALAAIEAFSEGQLGVRNLLNNPALLEQVTLELDQKLGESLKKN